MQQIINEKVVMQFYLDEIKNDRVSFLVGRDEYTQKIINYINEMLNADKMNEKIKIACGLWKALFEASMSFIDPEKQGYDNLFSFFDEFVEFEELIFASDSFYRDHTLHCLWVYFLGEYIYKKEEFNSFLCELKKSEGIFISLKELFTNLNLNKYFRTLDEICNSFSLMEKYDEAQRCVSALAHDLGYPIKKITKINKSMKKILPYFSINTYNDFSFEYSNIQLQFIEGFINFISSDHSYSIQSKTGKNLEFLDEIVFELDDKGSVLGLKKDVYERITPEMIEDMKINLKAECRFDTIPSLSMDFSHEFEEYHHGIMSAFLLTKNLRAFQNLKYVYGKNENGEKDFAQIVIKKLILLSIANHTKDTFRISKIDSDSYLTFIDELEEFSRISRASQNREYVEEFCSTYIYMEDGWLNINFEFDNDTLDNLDPEIAFKGRCKRFLTIFDVPHLSDETKIKLRCIGKLDKNKNVYTLELAKNHVDILINDQSVNIPAYLKTTQFYSKEEYARL